MHTAQEWLQKIRDLPLPNKVRLMNVCGGHERSISMAGLRKALPSQIDLIPGPGCPVCVCPEQDIYQAIQMALQEDIVLVSFGDMLRCMLLKKTYEHWSRPKRQVPMCAR
jgi:hydrogenase expression/formation protein HypD